jgi:hypothetical protein
MSLIVIWLHFFLQTEIASLTADNADKTDLHGSKAISTQNPFGLLSFLRVSAPSVVGVYKLLKVSGFFFAGGGVFFSGMVSSTMIFFTPPSSTT